MSALKLWLFGSPRVELNGTIIELTRRKALALLIYLAVNEQPHSRDALATLFYPDHSQSKARAYLRRDLALLNTTPIKNWLEADRETVELKKELWSDVAHFRRLMVNCHEQNQPIDLISPACLETLSEAVELYAADFLAGFTLRDCPDFDDWQFFQAESLRQELAAVLERLGQGYGRQGHPEIAIPYFRRWVALDPLHELAQQALIQMYDQVGQPTAALRQYEGYADLLDAELGLPPGEETQTLYEAIKAKRMLGAYVKNGMTPERKSVSTISPQPLASQLVARSFTPVEQLEYEPAWPQFLDEVQSFLQPASPSATPHQWQSKQSSKTPSPVPTGQQVFVARQQELARLKALLDSALGGQAQVAFVIGEAGQGKTALLQAFAQRTQDIHPNLIVASGNCNAYTGRGDPYLPFREILALLTGDIEARAVAGTIRPNHADHLQQTLPITAQALVEVAPDLLNRFVPAGSLLNRAIAAAPPGVTWLADLQQLAIKHQDIDHTNVQQVALFEQYAKVLQRVAQQIPVLLFLDDLQWIDPGSAGLLLHLGRRLMDVPVLIIGTYRPSEVLIGRGGERHPLEQIINEFQRLFGDIQLDLSQAEGEVFIEALLDSQPNTLDRDFRQTLYRQTQGHALFTVELLRDMQERGDLVQDEADRWLAQPGLDWQSLPARVEGAIGERISRLETPLRDLLQVASIEGEEFSAEVIAQVLKIDKREVVSRLSRELDKKHHLVRALGFKRDGTLRLSRYRFRHILIQRYLYNRLDDVERVYQHEAVGHALETIYRAQADEITICLARHFEAAEMLEQAIPYLQKAGDQARRTAALDEAAGYYRRALENWAEADKAGQATLQRKLGECLWILGNLQDALKLFERCYELFDSLEDKVSAGAIQRLMGRIYWELGDRERSLEHYERALAILEKAPQSVELAWAISSISQMHMLATEHDQAIAWGERALALAEQLQAEDVTVHALTNVGSSYLSIGQADRGQQMLEKSAQQALDLGLPHDACRAYLNLGEGLIKLDRYPEAVAVLEKLLVYAERVQVPLYAGSAVIELAQLEWLLGNWRAALNRRQQISEWIERGQAMTYVVVWAHNLFSQMYNDVGQPEAARQSLASISELVASRDELQSTGPHLAQVMRAQALLGLKDEANDVLQTFLDGLNRAPYIQPAVGASVLLPPIWWSGRHATPEAIDIARTFLGHLERTREQTGSPQFEAGNSEGKGAIFLYEGQYPEAVEHLQKAVDSWQTLGRPYDQLRALNGLAQALMYINDTTQAQAAVDKGLDIIQTLADELDEADIKATFLNSRLVQEIHNLCSALETRSQLNLPAQSTPFIGREKEVAEISQLLQDESSARLVTLVGLGGIGKTRLALEVAAQIVPTFPHGVYFVSLAPLVSAEEIASTIAQAIDFHFYEGSEPKQQLLGYLHSKHMLLVLDNFEHLISSPEGETKGGAAFVAAILTSAPHLKILTTSRERLNLTGETIHTVSGLTIPDQMLSEEVLDFEATQLLVQQARLTQPDFAPQANDVAQLIRICRLTQGMPLALVMAACWLEMLSLKEIADEIEQNLDFLEAELRDMPIRQRSVRATFDSSWKRLTTGEQQVFMKLSVCRGGFTRQAAQAVAGADLQTLRKLVNKSFIKINQANRYDIHELLRQFGEENLKASGEADSIRNIHCEYYLTILHEREADLRGRRQLAAQIEIEADLENIRVAWYQALHVKNESAINGALESLQIFFYLRSHFQEGAKFFGLARERLAPPPGDQPSLVWGRILTRLGLIQSHFVTANRELEADIDLGQAIAKTNDDPTEIALSFLVSGYYLVYAVRDPVKAMKYFEQSLELYQTLNDHFYMVQALIWIGYCHGATTGLEYFFNYHYQGLDLARESGDKVHEAYALTNLAAGEFCAGDYVAAERYTEAALSMAQAINRPVLIAHANIRLSLNYLLHGDIAKVGPLAKKGLDQARDLNYSTTIAYGLALLGLQAGVTGDYEGSRTFGEESINTPSIAFGQILGHWSLSMAYCGLREGELAWQQVCKTIDLARTAAYPAMITWPLPVAATLLAQSGQKEQAVTLLALASTHPLSPTGWQAQWSLLTETQATLETELGTEAYQEAWAQGQALDLETVVVELLDQRGHLNENLRF